MDEVAIAVEHLWKTFRLVHRATTFKGAVLQWLSLRARRGSVESLTALSDVTFQVPAGQTVGIVGRNGAGKSTLLAVLGRIYRPTRGRFRVRGRVATLLELGTGIHPELTGLENIYLSGTILGMKRQEIRRKLDDIIAFAELEPFIDTQVKGYSSGMMMRLGFAVAVHVDPDVLLVDEVLAVGDELFQRKCYAKIEEFQAQGKTILFVSHDLEAVRRVANRVLWLDQSVLRADGPPEEVLAQYTASLQEANSSPNSLRNRQWVN
ncbi:MAG TPA: ABC transporter ATP-binding protein [Armatimonadetes bacterium]|nr:ABC transporter ATP-binding protein [Armatimonadota bacterium]